MEVVGEKGLVSMVEGYVEEVVHRHMMGLIGNYKVVHHIYHLGMHLGMALNHSNLVEVGCHEEVHHNYCLGMHNRMVVGHSALEEVVAKTVDQILVAPPIFDCSNHDACCHYNLLFLQHNYNHALSQRGENSLYQEKIKTKTNKE